MLPLNALEQQQQQQRVILKTTPIFSSFFIHVLHSVLHIKPKHNKHDSMHLEHHQPEAVKLDLKESTKKKISEFESFFFCSFYVQFFYIIRALFFSPLLPLRSMSSIFRFLCLFVLAMHHIIHKMVCSVCVRGEFCSSFINMFALVQPRFVYSSSSLSVCAFVMRLCLHTILYNGIVHIFTFIFVLCVEGFHICVSHPTQSQAKPKWAGNKSEKKKKL